MKYFSSFIFAIIFCLGITPHALAQERMIYPPDVASMGSILGQDQAYTVYLRGNGEAVVNFRAVFTNDSDVDQKEYVLTFPEGAPVTEDLIAYQVIKEPMCVQYETFAVTAGTTVGGSDPACLKYEDSSYYNIYGQNRYIRVNPAITGNELRVPLQETIEASKSGSIVLSYRSFSYTDETVFDTYRYTFETLKSDQEIQNLNLGIRVDPQLVIKKADANVSYTQSESLQSLDKAMSAAAPTGERNNRLDSFYADIGYGVITETSSYLQAGDTYKVTGEYATSLLKLYVKQIVIGLMLMLGFILALVLIGQHVRKILRDRQETAKTAAEKQAQQRTEMMIIISTIGFIAALLLTLYSFGLYFYATYISSYWYNNLQSLVALFIVVLSAGLYPTVLFGPAIAIGLKRGWISALATVIVTLIWFVILFFLGLVIIMSTQRSKDDVMPMYDMSAPAQEPAIREIQQ
ncbi:MAG: hypothetical protein ACEQSA_00315 [Weeksellaceae bacterium]